MRIIDVHTHIFRRVAGITGGAPMVGEPLGRVKIGNTVKQFLPPAFADTASTAETLLAYMDWVGIEKALLMPNPYYGYHNEYFIESVNRWPDRLRAVALVDMLGGEKAARELETLYSTTPLFGFKIEVDSTFQCAPGARMAAERFAPLWECIDAAAGPVFLHLFRREDIEDLAQLVGRYPHITFVVCHMGADACFGTGAQKDAYTRVLEIAKASERVYLDTSTVPVYYPEEYPFASAIAVIERAWRELGPEKLLWASDYPGMLNHATMRQLVNLVVNGCTEIPAHHKELIMGENARRLFFS